VHRMNDFHQFRMGSRTWSTVRSTGQVPSPRYFHACVVHANSLFLFGGYSGQERLNDLYEFRFDHHSWSMVQAEAPPSGRSSLVAAVHENSLFIFGGYNGTTVLNDFYECRFEPVTIPPSSLVEDMSKLVNNSMFSDVVFLVEGKQVHATKAHLAARSEHFRALFYGGMRESAASREGREIELPGMQYNVFLALLEYIYTDKVGDLQSDLAVHVLIAAEKYCLDRLKALCEDIIRKSICIDNVVPVMLAANAHRADGLKDICLDFIIANEERIKASGRFKEIMQEPTLMYEIIMRGKSGI